MKIGRRCVDSFICTAIICVLARLDMGVPARAATNGTSALSPGAAPGIDQPPEIWRDARYGGRNCLLFLLYIYGDVNDANKYLGTIDQYSPPQTAGAIVSLADELGFPVMARSVSSEDLDTVQLPVIVHLDGDNPTEGSFHVLLGRNSSRFAYMNGPATVILSEEKELFLRRWSGVVIMPRPKNTSVTLQTVTAFSIGLGFALFGGFMWHWIRCRSLSIVK
jgi:hypothetical protein